MDAYSEIQSFCLDRGLALGDNDLWIAATSKVAGAHLISTDKDFAPMSPGFFAMSLLDSKTGALISGPQL